MKDLPKEALVRLLSLIPDDPAKALEKILPEMCVAEVTKVDCPTAAQLQKLRSLDPYTKVGLIDLKEETFSGLDPVRPRASGDPERSDRASARARETGGHHSPGHARRIEGSEVGSGS